MDHSKVDAIIQGCKRGNKDDFSRLVDIYAGPCYGYFYRLTGDKSLSDDLLSELFVKLIDRIQSYNGGSFKSWLFTIASNLWRDHLRSQYRRKRLAEEKSLYVSEFGHGDTEKVELHDELQVALKQLDPDTAEIIVLRYYSEMSFKELSKARKEPIGTTLAKVHRGLKKLKQIMGEPNENEQRKSENLA
ncbi:Sigma-W factor [Anaerohalosphaera lusitana]|uniref:Sigma-W factor n=1 Tax=Anaerohalosphaera lusitana TaxID=1936003 RepID=A0A1U9NND3_9BACT|nr:RNA polymerase sigma factor [Anaerohalosphaera lusitana]AQT69026.1 Sigma-W factor [Anaerohalosphaera lusitana]